MSFTPHVRARIDAVLASCDSAFAAKARAFLSMELPWVVVDYVSDAHVLRQRGTTALLVLGDVDLDENVLVESTAKGADTFLVVLGSVRCRNLVVASQASFVCAGALAARETIVCEAADSVSVVAGSVNATLLVSGGGAWLQIFDDAQLVATYLSGFVMVGRHARRRVPPPVLEKIVLASAIDARAWDALDEADREGEVMSDHLRVDASVAQRLIAAGGTILIR